MSQIHEIPKLDRKGLREFAFVTGAILVVLFGLFIPWLLENNYPRWPWIFAGVLAAWGLVLPKSLQLVYRSWMKFGLLLSRITTPLILGIVFYGMFFPMGFIMRLFGRDPMQRSFDDAVKSYRVSRQKSPRKNVERPF